MSDKGKEKEFDDVLKRMLRTRPEPHKHPEKKEGKKSSEKKKKPA